MWKTAVHYIVITLTAVMFAGSAFGNDQSVQVATAPPSAVVAPAPAINKLPVSFSGEWQRQNLNTTRLPLKARTDIRITYQDESGNVKGLLSSYAVGTPPPNVCGSIIDIPFEGTWDGETLSFATVDRANPCERRTYVLTLGKRDAKEPYFKGVSKSDPSWSVWYEPVMSPS